MRRDFNSFPEAVAASREDWGIDYRVPMPTTEEAAEWWDSIKHREHIPYIESVKPVNPDFGTYSDGIRVYPNTTQKRKCEDCGRIYHAHYNFEWHCQNCREHYLRLRFLVWERMNRDRIAKMKADEEARKPKKPQQLNLF